MTVLRSLVLGILAFLAVSCSPAETAQPDQSPPVLPFEPIPTTTTTLLIDGRPDIELSAADTALVRFEAAWVCELQRRTFTDSSAIEDALEQKLVETGLTAGAYADFRIKVSDDRDLRRSILFEYQETCRT